MTTQQRAHCQGFLACERRSQAHFSFPMRNARRKSWAFPEEKAERLPWFCWSAPSETKRDVLLEGAVVWKRTQATSKVFMSFKK